MLEASGSDAELSAPVDQAAEATPSAYDPEGSEGEREPPLENAQATSLAIRRGITVSAKSRATAKDRVDAVFDRIIQNRLIVTEHVTPNGRHYSVSGLEAELASLTQPSAIALLQARLRERHRYQELEVGRLLQWAQTRAPSSLASFDEALRLAGKAIRTLHGRWATHPRMITFRGVLPANATVVPTTDAGKPERGMATKLTPLSAQTVGTAADDGPAPDADKAEADSETLVDLLWHMQHGCGVGR